MHRCALLLLLLVLLVPAAGAGAPLPGFRSADGGVSCKLVTPGRLVCQGKSSGSMSIRTTGTPVSTRTTVASTGVFLARGKRWARDGITCLGGRTVECTNRSGALLLIGRATVAVVPG